MILILVMILLTFAGYASAGIPEVSANNRYSVEPDEEFDLVIIIDSHGEANYTVEVTLHPRFEFSSNVGDMEVTNNSAEITYLGYDTDSIRFEFPMMAKNETPEGDYNVPYKVFWNGSETSFNLTSVEEGTVRVSVGEGGSEGGCNTAGLLVLPIAGLGTSYVVDKKKKR
jgi:hypothetical protein